MARGVVTLIDDINFFVETRDLPNAILNVTATSTSTQNGADQQNTGPGAALYIAFTSVVATATVRINVQAKDPVSLQYITIASISIDNLSATTTGNAAQLLYIYPGATGAGGSNVTAIGTPLPRTFRVQASITVINATATSAVQMSVGMSRIGGL